MSVGQVKLLKTYLDFLVEKNKVISENIANRDSVNYRKRSLNFSEYLEKEKIGTLKTTEPKHIAKPIESDIQNTFQLENGNEYDVDNGEINIENEMAELAKNTLNFEFASKQVNNIYKKLHFVIKGGNY
jgi:flagellar basal-body rod protein FlgB